MKKPYKKCKCIPAYWRYKPRSDHRSATKQKQCFAVNQSFIGGNTATLINRHERVGEIGDEISDL